MRSQRAEASRPIERRGLDTGSLRPGRLLRNHSGRNPPPTPDRDGDQQQLLIRSEQITLLHAGIPSAATATLINAGVLAAVQWSVIEHRIVLAWLIGIVAITLGRLWLAWRFRTTALSAGEIEPWTRRFLVGSGLASIAWGAASVFMFPPANTTHQVFLAFVIAGMSAGAVTTLSPLFEAALGFLFLALAPLALRLFAVAEPIQLAMGLMVSLFFIVVVISARRLATNVVENIRLRVEAAPREQALRRNEEFLNRTGKLAEVGGWELDVDTMSLRWTDQTFRIHELPIAEPPVLERSFRFYAPSARDLIRNAIDRAITEGEPFDLELPFITAKEGRRWVRTIGEPHVENGRTRRLTGALQDISARKQAEESLRRSSASLQRLHEIAANTAMGLGDKIPLLMKLGIETFKLPLAIVSRIEGDRYFVEYAVGPEFAPPPGSEFPVSETCCALTLQANSPYGFHHAGESTVRDHPCYKRFELEAYVGTPLFVDGRRYGTLSFSSPDARDLPFSDSELSLIRLFAQWIGNEMSRERAAANLKHFKDILDNTLDMIFMFEPESLRFVYINKGAMSKMGYSREELLTMTPYQVKPEVSEETFRQLIAPLLEGKQQSLSFESLHRRKDGTDFPVEVFLQLVRTETDPGMFIAIVHDITERKKVDQLKNEFISTVSHELRTPLTSIHGSMRLLTSGVLGELSDKAQSLADIAVRNSERLLRLIGDILDMEKIASGRMDFDLRIQPLMPIVEQAIEANTPYARELGVGLNLAEGVYDAQAEVDSSRLLQVMSNLLSNAAKFSPGGSRVTVAVTRRDRRLRVTVTDEGAGIPEEFHDRIFEKFSQADASDSRRSGGTGLGLAISKRIIEHMGGRIGFETQTGAGTTFYFELPESNA